MERPSQSERPSVREIRPRKASTEFSVKSTEEKLTSYGNELKQAVDLDTITTACISANLFISCVLVLIPTLLNVFSGHSFLARIITAPFTSIYKTYCSLSLDPFICKPQPGWMYAPLFTEIALQLPLLSSYFYYSRTNQDKHKHLVVVTNGLVVLVKTLPILLETAFDDRIAAKKILYLIYGSKVVVSLALATVTFLGCGI